MDINITNKDILAAKKIRFLSTEGFINTVVLDGYSPKQQNSH